MEPEHRSRGRPARPYDRTREREHYRISDGLLQAAQRFQQAGAELEALERPKYTEDYPEGTAQQEAALMEERRRLAEQIVVHSFWESLTGPDLVAARTALKQAAKAALSKQSA